MKGHTYTCNKRVFGKKIDREIDQLERDNSPDVPPVGHHIVDWAVREIELMHEENCHLRKKNRYLRRKNSNLRKKLQSLKKMSTEVNENDA